MPTFTATGGTEYHLVLHNGPLSNNNYSFLYWETTDPNGTNTGRRWDLQVDGPWNDNHLEDAFNLSNAPAVPEPSSFALLGIAGATFAGYFGWRRRWLALA